MDKIRFLFLQIIILFFGLNIQLAYASLPDLHGFLETDVGVKVSDDNTKQDTFNLLEERLQLKTTYFFEGNNYLADKGAMLNFRGDFVIDAYYDGKTDFELRELNLSLTPFDFMDLKIGQQVLTWGTGDYLFINDLFPKDYISFFIGRNDEYLKKPTFAIKTSFHPDFASIDFIVMPYFTPNTIAKGDRLSFFDSFRSGIAGIDSDRHIISPPHQFSNNEYALRMYKNIKGNELAIYFFHGYDKNPRSYKDESAKQLYYERIDAYGLSLRGSILGGIGNIETGYYNSREDTDGTNRMIENSMFKTMIGYSKDMGNDLRIGFQYMYEQRLNYDNYRDNLLPTDYFWDEFRHLLTNRITKLFNHQTVTLSLFTFYSPSDRDGYFRPSVTYEINDQLKATLGADLPWGEDDITEFGQMKRNKNIYIRIRYSF